MKFYLLLFLSVFYINNAECQDEVLKFQIPPPTNEDSLIKFSLWATYYHIPIIHSSGKVPFVNKKGEPIGVYGTACDFCDAAVEGTVYIVDSSNNVITLNHAGTGKIQFVDCKNCKKYKKPNSAWGYSKWFVTNAKFGKGTSNYNLVPYRTIAVDKNLIKIGSVIYIPSAKGIKIFMPDSSILIHDGYFFAGDVGGNIKGNHIDIFAGIYQLNPFPKISNRDSAHPFTAFLVKDDSVINNLKKRSTSLK